MKIPCIFQVRWSRFLCNSPDEPLKVSGLPSVSRSFSIEDIRTSGQHRPDDWSSFSNYYTVLDFSQHYLGSFCNASEQHGNLSGRYPAFQNIPSFLYKHGKELQWKPSGCSTKSSWHGHDIGRNCANLEGGRRRPSGRGNLLSKRSTARVRFWAKLGFL